MNLQSLTATLLLLSGAALAETNNPATDWFSRAGYGVFVHYLNELQNNADALQSLGRSTSWDECVREFDTERFAAAMAEAGAGYVIFTTHQRTRFLIAPNPTFDRLTGYKPGEACATRDLIADLHRSLSARNIPLMLYWTGNGPSADPKAAAALGFTAPVNPAYVEKWAGVIEDYALRYGDKIAGWWVDGAYEKHGNLGYSDATLAPLARALKAGNPHSIIAFNPGVELTPYSIHSDYTAGEQNTFGALPDSRWLGGQHWHILSYLGHERPDNHLSAGWCEPGLKYTKRALANYVTIVNRKRGTVSIDILLYRDGSVDRSQLETLKALRPALISPQNPAPVPAGNLAYRKPARLLSLDGHRPLPANSGGTQTPELGVDGFPDTAARASDEWPWTYEVDLLAPHPLRRIKATFSSRAYATRVRVTVSDDHAFWREVATLETPTGHPASCAFPPVVARYIRIGALKPDGPGQTGEQMAVSELEAYE